MDNLGIRGIDPILDNLAREAIRGSTTQTNGLSFGDLLKNAVESVNHLQHQAGRLEDGVAKGDDVSIHQAIIAGEKAGLSFQLMMQMRNKMLEAYKEVLRMQV